MNNRAFRIVEHERGMRAFAKIPCPSTLIFAKKTPDKKLLFFTLPSPLQGFSCFDTDVKRGA